MADEFNPNLLTPVGIDSGDPKLGRIYVYDSTHFYSEKFPNRWFSISPDGLHYWDYTDNKWYGFGTGRRVANQIYQTTGFKLIKDEFLLNPDGTPVSSGTANTLIGLGIAAGAGYLLLRKKGKKGKGKKGRKSSR